METFTLVMMGTLYLALGLLVCCVCALFEQPLRDTIGNFFAIPLRPLLLINSTLDAFWQGVRRFYRTQFSVNGQLDPQAVFYHFIGAFLYALFFIAFTFSDFHLLALSLVAAGIDVGHFEPPFGAGALTAISVIASVLFWGSVLCDLIGLTHTAPWRESLSRKWQKYLMYVVIFCLSLSLVVSVSMGLYRGKVIADGATNRQNHTLPLAGGLSDLSLSQTPQVFGSAPENNEDGEGLYYWIPIFANVCIPILVIISGVFSCWGVVTIIKFILLASGFIVLIPAGVFALGSNLSTAIVDRFYQFFDAILRLLSAIGRRILRLLGIEEGNQPQPPDQPGAEQGGDGVSSEPSQSVAPRDSPENPSTPGTSGPTDGIKPPSEGWNPYE